MTALNDEFEAFKRCAERAPEGTHHQAKQLGAILDETCDELMRRLRAVGLRANACDAIYRLEVALYEYAKKSNPGSPLFSQADGTEAGAQSPLGEPACLNATPGACAAGSDQDTTFLEGTWSHLFGPGSSETACRIVIGMPSARVVAAKLWQGRYLEPMSKSFVADLEESVIEVNQAHLSPAEFGLEEREDLPSWAQS
ncbi:hypothetical protein [Paracidovorax citrulli]|uniref:hypothetical protein n=1 Tax=Paracidovorax citrulli TaxID=80869 RepID=UPI003FA6DE0B